MVGCIIFLGWTYLDQRIEWKDEWQRTVDELEQQNKFVIATHLRQKGPDSFAFRLYARKPYLVRSVFVAMLSHILVIGLSTRIPIKVLAYRYLATTSRITPFIVALAFLSSWLPWVNLQYASEAASIQNLDEMTPTEIQLHLAVSRAYGSLIHCLWIGWWTYVLATWSLSVTTLYKASRLLLPKSTVKMYDQRGTVY
jgi:hypothetical protein